MRKKAPSLLLPLLITLLSVVFQTSSQADLAADLETLVRGGRPADPSPALGALLVSADEGDATAQWALGNVYYQGAALKKNYAKALEYTQLAADQGHIRAIGNLGTFYYRGYGVAKDISKGLALWKKAADAGDVSAMFNFGDSHYTGDSGTPKDLTLGAQYLVRAAEHGHGLAQMLVKKFGLQK